MSDLVLDGHRALSTTNGDEWIRIPYEIERINSKTLMVIDVDPYSCALWYGVIDVPDIRYIPSPYVPHILSSHIP